MVKWDTKSASEVYNVVSLNDVEVLAESETEYSFENVLYKVKFGLQKCKAFIVFIGNLNFLIVYN